MKISKESLNLHCVIGKRIGYEAFKRDCKDKSWHNIVDKQIVLDNPFLDDNYLEKLKNGNKEVYEREVLGIWDFRNTNIDKNIIEFLIKLEEYDKNLGCKYSNITKTFLPVNEHQIIQINKNFIEKWYEFLKNNLSKEISTSYLIEKRIEYSKYSLDELKSIKDTIEK